jgi:hypothetical protein
VIAGLSNSTTYYWRVRAKNAGGVGGYCVINSFTTIVAVPGQPVALSPANGATGASTSPTLQWSAAIGAVTYQLEVATDSTLSTVILRDTTLTSTSRVISGLSYSTNYYWHVRAKNAGGVGAFSSIARFSVYAPSLPNVAVYSDVSLNSPWTDVQSWRVKLNYGSTSPVYSGSTALLVTHKPWASLQFTQGTWGGFTAFNPASYASVQFALHGGVKGVTLQVCCNDASGNAVGSTVTVSAPVASWVFVTIPMNQLATRPFNALTFTAGGSYVTFSLDALTIVAIPPGGMATITGVVVESGAGYGAGTIPTEYSLDQNYPNPFNPETIIRYSLSDRANVLVAVYDVSGKEVARVQYDEQAPGVYERRFSGLGLSSGAYIYRLLATSADGTKFSAVKKMVLLK